MEESQGKVKSLTILEKLSIIEMVDSGKSIKDVAEQMGINRNTLHYIMKMKDKIRNFTSNKPGLSKHKRIKQTKNPELEQAVLNFIFEARENGEKLTGSIIKAYALETSIKMNCSTNFSASNGWLFSFFKRNNISISDFNRKSNNENENEMMTTVVYEEIQEGDDGSMNNMKQEEIEITEESMDDYEVTYTINWRDWCRICGNTDTDPNEPLDPHIFENVKNLFVIVRINEDAKFCKKCITSLKDIAHLIDRGKVVESMLYELEEREKTECLDDRNVLNIRNEYGIDEEVENCRVKVNDDDGDDDLVDFENTKEQENHSHSEKNYDMQDIMYEVDYLEEDEQQQENEEREEQHFEMVEEETIEEIDEEFNDTSALKLLKDEDMFNYTCHVCDETFDRMCFLTNHTRTIHDCLPQVACSCGKFLATWESLMAHKRKHSVEIGEWICDNCNSRFMTKAGLSIHVKFKHEKPRQTYHCNVCDKEFKDSQTLRSHERIHLPHEQKFLVECKICFKKLANKYSLRHHIASVHEQQKTIICHLCSKRFSSKSNLKSHLISHTTEYVKCDICDAVFKNSVSLQSHKKVHKDKELLNFPCTECDKRFHNRNHLQRHMISHSDIRKYRCNVCEMAYKWEKDLKNHMSIHNGEKEHKCSWCERMFVDSGNLRKHKLKYHPAELAEFEARNGKGRKMFSNN